jgi:hypothetical protein
MYHHAELLRAFRMGPEDLTANRTGRLGPRQVVRLRQNIWWNLGAGVLIEAGVVGLALLSLRGDGRANAWFLLPIFGLVTAALAAAGYSWTRNIRRAIRSGTVECFTGPVTVQSARRGGTWIVVAGERFRLWTGYWHVGRGRPYHVYVAPAAKLIVAMEPDGWS